MSENDQPSTLVRRPIVLLTGMSGAGLLTALKEFEDLGYESVDNLRLGMVRELVDVSKGAQPLAIAIDTRNPNFSIPEVLAIYTDLKADPSLWPRLLFLDCSDEALQRRFTETRRRHPLAVDRPVTDGIRREREMLWALRDEADQVIDTSMLSMHDLRRIIGGSYNFAHDLGLTIFVTSFAYRQGLPREADLVFDVRFLANPYWDPSLRGQTGQEPGVAEYIKKDEDYQSFMDHLSSFLLPLLPRYQQEGKSYLTIAFGCTGGRHRSVFIAEECGTFLAGKGYIVAIGHRDMDRQKAKG